MSPAGRTWMFLSLAFLLVVLGAGCPTPIRYTPNDALVDDIGPTEAERRLQETIMRATQPPISSADATEDFYVYRHGANETKVFYANVERMEIYENNVIYMYATGGRFMGQIIFSNRQDATTFADLVMAFRARRMRAEGRPL